MGVPFFLLNLYNNNNNMKKKDFAIEMEQIVDGLGTSTPTKQEWDSIKKALRNHLKKDTVVKTRNPNQMFINFTNNGTD